MIRDLMEKAGDLADKTMNAALWILMVAAVAIIPALWYVDAVTPHIVLIKAEWRCTEERGGSMLVPPTINACDEYRRIKKGK